MKITASKVIELDRLILKSVEHNLNVWVFEFESYLRCESHSCWRLLEVGIPNDVICGPRDIEGEEDLFAAFSAYVPTHSVRVLTFDAIANVMHIGFFNDEDKSQPIRRLEFIATSASMVNWKIVGEDFSDDDQQARLLDP